jgi:hypothetical protein
LKKFGITHIVNTAADVCESSFPDEIQYLTYYLKDTKTESISSVFHRTLEWIEAAIVKGGTVLVHCREGVSRSSTIVIAYLIWKQSLPFEQAYELVRSIRMICNPNAGFTCQLILFGKRLGTSGPEAKDAEVFRLAPHNPNAPLLLLLPVELQPGLTVIDPRFAYVAQRGTSLAVLLGREMPDRAAALEAIEEHRQAYERVERRSYASLQLIEQEDAQKFWGIVDCKPFPVRSVAKFDSDFELLKPKAPPVGEETSNGTHAVDAEPQLYMFPEMEDPLDMFDSDDLDAAKVFVLFVPDGSRAHVWIGSDFTGGLSEDELMQVGASLLQRLGCRGKVELEYDGEESERFWEAFQNG